MAFLFSSTPEALRQRRTVNIPVAATRELEVGGSNMGQASCSGAARLGHSASPSTSWISDSGVSLQVAQGRGGSLRVAVTLGLCANGGGFVDAGRCMGSLTDAMSFDGCQPSAVTRSNAPTTGGVAMVVWGNGLASYNPTPSLHVLTVYGQEECHSMMWASSSSISCRSPGGYGSGLSAVVIVGESLGTMTSVFSYDAPLVTSIEPARLATSGAAYVWIHGHNFGHTPDVSLYCLERQRAGENMGSNQTEEVCVNLGSRLARPVPHVSIGQTSCKEAVWVNSDTLRCLAAPAGVGHSLVVRASIAAQVGFLTQAASYNAPDLTDVVPATLHAESAANRERGLLLTLTGAFFGTSDSSIQVRVGVTAAEASFYVSDTSVTCRIASGAGPAWGVTITVGTDCGWDTGCGKGVFDSNICGPAHEPCAGPLSVPKGGHADGVLHQPQTGHKLEAFSYRAPAVSIALPAQPVHYPWTVRLSSSLSTSTISTTPSPTSTTLSPSLMTSSSTLTMAPTAPSSTSTTPSPTATTMASTTPSTTPSPATTMASTTPSSTSTTPSPTSTTMASTMASTTPSTTPPSSTSTTPSSTSTTMASTTPSTTPSPTSTTPSSTSTAPSPSPGVCAVAPERHLSRCGVLGGVGGADTGYGGNGSSATVDVEYAETPAHWPLSPTPFAVGNLGTPCSALLLAGAHLGTGDYSSRVRVGHSAAAATVWTSVTQVWVRVAFGGGYMLAVSVSVEMHTATTSKLLSFDRVVVDRGNRSSRPQGLECDSEAGVNGPAAGNVEMRFWGAALGYYDYSAMLRLGATNSPRTRWEADSALLARSAVGESPVTALSVTVGGGAAAPACAEHGLCVYGADGLTRPYTLSEAVSYDMVYIRSVVEHVVVLERVSAFESINSEWGSAAGSPASGGVEVGDEMAGATIDADSHAFEALAHAHVHAASSPGGPAAVAKGPGERDAAARAQGKAEEDAHVSRYSNGPATPSQFPLLTHLLAVSNAASHDYSARARLADTASEASRWISDTALTARPGSGAGRAFCHGPCDAADVSQHGSVRGPKLVLTLASRAGSSSELHSYDSAMRHTITPCNRPTIATSSSSIAGPRLHANGSRLTPEFAHVSGVSMGAWDTSLGVRLQHTAAERTWWISDSIMLVKASGGSQARRALEVTQAQRRSTFSDSFSFDAPRGYRNENCNGSNPQVSCAMFYFFYFPLRLQGLDMYLHARMVHPCDRII